MRIKILNATENHRDFQYVEGWNTCPDYEPTAACGNGLHYTDDIHWARWTSYGDHFREVLDTVGTVEIDETKSKAEKLCLGPHRPFTDLLVTEPQQLAAVTSCRDAIQLIKGPSEAVQLAAVKTYGHAIMNIKDPSEQVQLAAVTKEGSAIKHIKNPSEALKLAAVTDCGYAIAHIKDPSEEVQIAAVTQNHPFVIEYIKNPSEKVQLAAIKK